MTRSLGRLALALALTSTLTVRAEPPQPAPPVPAPPEPQPAPPAPQPAPPEPPPASPAPGPEAELDAALAEGRLGAASMRCEQLAAAGPLAMGLRERCGRILLALGDRLRDSGSAGPARARWEQAAAYDPRLLDDSSYLARLKGDSVATATTDPAKAGTTDPAKAGTTDPAKAPTPTTHEEVEGPGPDSGPRWDLGFAMGLSFGFDGLAAATLGWLTDETLLLEVSFGIVYPATDVRVRWLGLRNCLTPFLGFGILVPFGQHDRMGLELSGYENLYELGESFHVDVGLAYMPLIGLDLYAGVSFLTPMDFDHPDTVLLFPQFTAGASWYF